MGQIFKIRVIWVLGVYMTNNVHIKQLAFIQPSRRKEVISCHSAGNMTIGHRPRGRARHSTPWMAWEVMKGPSLLFMEKTCCKVHCVALQDSDLAFSQATRATWMTVFEDLATPETPALGHWRRFGFHPFVAGARVTWWNNTTGTTKRLWLCLATSQSGGQEIPGNPPST